MKLRDDVDRFAGTAINGKALGGGYLANFSPSFSDIFSNVKS